MAEDASFHRTNINITLCLSQITQWKPLIKTSSNAMRPTCTGREQTTCNQTDEANNEHPAVTCTARLAAS